MFLEDISNTYCTFLKMYMYIIGLRTVAKVKMCKETLAEYDIIHVYFWF